MKKEDPRALRTQEMLKNAVVALLESGMSINQLSVQKVTKEARLNRTTFYLHYQDIDDLIVKLMDGILQELSEKIEELIEEPGINEKNRLIHVLDFLYGQRHHLLGLFQIEQFEQHLFHLMKKVIEVRRENLKNPTAKMFINLEVKTASLVGVIMWWLKNGLHYSSEYIAEQIHLMYRM